MESVFSEDADWVYHVSSPPLPSTGSICLRVVCFCFREDNEREVRRMMRMRIYTEDKGVGGVVWMVCWVDGRSGTGRK